MKWASAHDEESNFVASSSARWAVDFVVVASGAKAGRNFNADGEGVHLAVQVTDSEYSPMYGPKNVIPDLQKSERISKVK